MTTILLKGKVVSSIPGIIDSIYFYRKASNN